MRSGQFQHSFFLIFFFCTLILLVALCMLIQRPLPDRDYFDKGFAASYILGTELTAAKLAHARSNPIYDLALFGNSRSVMVSKTHLRAPGMSFFNFSVPGASIRHSIVMLEELARHGKSPRLSIISFDNAHLQFYGNAELRLPALQFRLAVQDAFTDKVSFKERARVVWRHIYQVGWLGVLRYFNWLELRKGLAFQKHGWSDSGEGGGYLADGSRPQGSDNIASKNGFIVQAPTPSVLRGYLIKDLERVARLASSARSRIVIFESPLAPQSQLLGKREHPVTTATRRTFRNACRTLKLTCVQAPLEHPALKTSGGWEDATHAPASSLGAYLTSLIKQNLE